MRCMALEKDCGGARDEEQKHQTLIIHCDGRKSENNLNAMSGSYSSSAEA